MTEPTKSQNNDSLFEDSGNQTESNNSSSNDSLFNGEPQHVVDEEYRRHKQREMNAALGALVGATAEGTEYLGHKAYNWAIPKIKEFFEKKGAGSGEPALHAPTEQAGGQGINLQRVTGPGQQIDNYTLSLMKHTPESQTISIPESKDILSPKEAQDVLDKNVQKIRGVQKVEPSAKVVSPETGLMAKTVPWQNPVTNQTEYAPAFQEVDPVTGKKRTVADPKWISSRMKVIGDQIAQAKLEANKSPFFEAVKDLGKGTGNFLYNIGRGALHGANAAVQGQSAIDKRNISVPETVAHSVSTLGSVADLIRPVLSEALDKGVGRFAGPVAVGGMGIADALEQMRKGEYNKLPITTVATPMLANPLTMPAGAAFLYLRDHPEQKEAYLKAMQGKSAYAHRGFGLD